MASEDVIELGSSEEESEPAPKKGKRQPNVMVHFPTKLPGITIKKTKLINGGNTKFMPSKPLNRPHVIGLAPRVSENLISQPIRVNPISFKNSVPLNRGRIKPSINPLAVNIPVLGKHILNAPKETSSPNCLSRLPKCVVIKKSIKQQNKKRTFDCIQTSSTIIKKLKPNHGVSVKNVVGMTHTKPSPVVGTVSNINRNQLWYLQPEKAGSSKENENNKEPDPSQMVEIVIEDSPIKPTPNRQSITIIDSPVRTETQKMYGSSGSDNEEKQIVVTTPKSKKKLGYATEFNQNKTIEIELEPIVITDSQTNENNVDCVIEVPESPQKKNIEKNVDISGENKTEFHPIYQGFIDLCFKLENSDDMKKIVEKKIKTYYRQVPKEYTESEEFLEMISCKMLSMEGSPDKMFLYIKDIVDELKMQRDMAKAQIQKKEEEEAASASAFYGEDIDKDQKKKRQVHKLEKTLKKLHRAIQKLEEQEVDFDDDGDSVYILTDRYKERLIRVHAKLCELTKTKMPSEPKVHLEPRPGRPAGPAKRLEKWINRRVPIGKPLPFPDFHDALRCVREANEEDNLHWNEVDIMEEARDLFTRCGRKLQRRRQENEWRIAASRLSTDIDPAKENEDLRQKLDNNRKLAASRECELINKFAEKQNQLKLEGEEIGDKEAEESPEESADEAMEEAKEEESGLEKTEDRKERLIRLIKEKSKKDKENKAERDKKINGILKINCDNKESNVSDAVETMNNSENMEVQEIKKDKNNDGKDEEKIDKDKDNTTIVERKEEEETKIEDESVSISSEDVQSDVDELHLLRRLHSQSEAHTSTSESDNESAIAISDSLSGSEDEENKQKLSKVTNDDVVSIENSSDSEPDTEMLGDDNDCGNNGEVDSRDSDLETIMEESEDESPKINNSVVNDEVLETQNEVPKRIDINEEILLASSEGDSQDSNRIENNPSNRHDDNNTNGNDKSEENAMESISNEGNKEMEKSISCSDTDSQEKVSNKIVVENNEGHDNENCISDIENNSTQKENAEINLEMDVAISKERANKKQNVVSEKENSVLMSHLEELEMEIQQLCEPDDK